jgi:hypothetical protein
MIFVIFALGAMLLAVAAAMLVGIGDVQAARNYRGAGQVHFVAESGILEALQLINGPGVVNFQNDVVGPWGNLWTPNWHPFTPLTGFNYSVAAVASPANPANIGQLIATATGVEGVRNVVVATLVRSNLPTTAPGAIYLATDNPTQATFNGNAFTVDGNDHNMDGTAGPAAPVPGISTRNATNTASTMEGLNGGQDNNVQGYGYQAGPPPIPSVITDPAAPSVTELNQMITDLLALPTVQTYNTTSINGGQQYGTTAAPQISHFTDPNGATLQANGNASGAGIMIVEGDLNILGNFSFDGLILVRGRTNVSDPSHTGAMGNATLYGSLWTEDFNLVVGGHATIDYSSQALNLANAAGGGGGTLPAPMQVTALADCSQVPSGAGGCP